MKKFEVGKQYKINMTASDATITIECIKKTAKAIIFLNGKHEIRCKLTNYSTKEETALYRNTMEIGASQEI